MEAPGRSGRTKQTVSQLNNRRDHMRTVDGVVCVSMSSVALFDKNTGLKWKGFRVSHHNRLQSWWEDFRRIL